MPAWGWVVIGVAIVVVAGIVVMRALRSRQTRALRGQFGPEYDRTLEDTASRREAEAELRDRVRRHESLELRNLDPAAAHSYREEWRRTQSDFVDHPSAAITDADLLIQRVMRERGYPIEDFDQRTADLSVEHPELVDNYRSAHSIAVSSSHGQATTEDLRRAMKRYRSLFDELVETHTTTEVTR